MEAEMNIQITGSYKPERATCGSVGYDLRNAQADVTIAPHSTVIVSTGIKLAMMGDIWAEVRPRSSTSKAGMHVATGTIDTDYRGEVGVCITNTTANNYTIKSGARIAQLVFRRALLPQLVQVDSLDATERGENGFGSTGEL